MFHYSSGTPACSLSVTTTKTITETQTLTLAAAPTSAALPSATGTFYYYVDNSTTVWVGGTSPLAIHSRSLPTGATTMVTSLLTTVHAYITHAPTTHTVYITVTEANSASAVEPSTSYTSASRTGSSTGEHLSTTTHLISFVTVHVTLTSTIGTYPNKSAAAISASLVQSGLSSIASVASPFSYSGSPGKRVLSTSTTQLSYLFLASFQKSLDPLSSSSNAVFSTNTGYTTQKVSASTRSTTIAFEYATSQSITSSPKFYTSIRTILVTEIIFVTTEASSVYETSDAQMPSTSSIVTSAGTPKFSNGSTTRGLPTTASIASHGSSMLLGPSTSQGRGIGATMCGESGNFTLGVCPPVMHPVNPIPLLLTLSSGMTSLLSCPKTMLRHRTRLYSTRITTCSFRMAMPTSQAQMTHSRQFRHLD